jgi:predicted transcriptional regulator
MKTRLSERLQVRISPELQDALQAMARRLHVRPADVVRMAVARAIADELGAETGSGHAAIAREGNDDKD